MYKKELQRVRPEEVGLSSRNLLAMVRELEACGTEMHGLMVVRHGKVAVEGWWEPYTSSTAHICHSMGKSYVATAVGLACTQGLLKVEDKIVDLLKEEIRQYHVNANENLEQLTVEHVLMMANGMSIHPASGEQLLKNYLTSTFDHAPGTRFFYNTTGSCLLGAIVMKVTGKTVREYLTEEIFDKIGLESDQLEWLTFRGNHVHAAPGVASSTENNLRLGMLYLQNGSWEGEQLISEEWIRKATTRRIRTDAINKESHLDDGAGYGYQLWICPEEETFKFAGGHGQDVVMSRKNDLVISLNQAANDGASRAENEIISRYLLAPKLSDSPLPPDEDGFREFDTYIHSLKIKDRRKESVPDNIDLWNGIYRVTEGSFHINTELRPMDDSNVYTDFYDHEDVEVKEISIYHKGDFLELVFDDGTYRARIEAYLDGSLHPVYTKGAIPIYTQTVSSAWAKEDVLTVETKFLQTCFWTRLTFHREKDSVAVQIQKERLHEDDPWISSEIRLKKILPGSVAY